MSGFATGIDTESGLKTVYFSTFCDFFGVFTALPDLQIYFQTGV